LIAPINYNKLHRKLVGSNCSIFWVKVKMRLPWDERWVGSNPIGHSTAAKQGQIC
jgi:hypothetical protein